MDTVLLDFLLNPNIAYLFLVGGVLLTFFALVTPGTGFLEIGAFFLIALAGYAIYNLPIHIWALILLLASVIPFVMAVRRTKNRNLYLGSSIIGVVIGSAYLFRGDGLTPAVNIFLVIIVSLLMGSFLWLVIIKTLEALESRPSHDLEGLVGKTGEAKSDIDAEGSVQVAGELWTAQSEKPIAAGARIRVVQRQGFILLVEETEEV